MEKTIVSVNYMKGTNFRKQSLPLSMVSSLCYGKNIEYLLNAGGLVPYSGTFGISSFFPVLFYFSCNKFNIE